MQVVAACHAYMYCNTGGMDSVLQLRHVVDASDCYMELQGRHLYSVVKHVILINKIVI